MKTTIVYVLISGYEDTYLEQLYLSMLSIRKFNDNIDICVVCDTSTKATFNDNREKMVSIANRIVSVEVPMEYNNMQKSRYIKTSLRKYIKGDFLYLDNDTIISDSLSSLDELPYSLMGVPDFHSELSYYPGKKALQRLSQQVGLNIDRHQYCFNGGVMYVKDDKVAHDFYECWHSVWKDYLKMGISTDQQSLFAANEKCGFPINKLDDCYNCQIMFNGLKYLYKAKVIHYFASGFVDSPNIEQPYIFQNSIHYQYIKDNGQLDEICEKNICKPKGAFIDNVQIVTSFQSDYNNTPFYAMTRNFYYNNRQLIRFISKIKKLVRR